MDTILKKGKVWKRREHWKKNKYIPPNIKSKDELNNYLRKNGFKFMDIEGYSFNNNIIYTRKLYKKKCKIAVNTNNDITFLVMKSKLPEEHSALGYRRIKGNNEVIVPVIFDKHGNAINF